jgi:hypothetical protein
MAHIISCLGRFKSMVRSKDFDLGSHNYLPTRRQLHALIAAIVETCWHPSIYQVQVGLIDAHMEMQAPLEGNAI